MKKIILVLILGFLVNSCSTSTYEPSYQFYLLPIYQVVMPESFTMNNVSNIVISYKRPTTCHIFSDFNYESDGFTRTIAIESAKVLLENCQTDTQTIVEVNFPFKPIEPGTYHFKFWTGVNSQGADQFIEEDVSVNY